jgi:molecular chaperone DnaK
MKLGEAIYQAEQAAAQPAGNAAAGSAGADDVVDAEFTDVDENNKK